MHCNLNVEWTRGRVHKALVFFSSFFTKQITRRIDIHQKQQQQKGMEWKRKKNGFNLSSFLFEVGEERAYSLEEDG